MADDRSPRLLWTEEGAPRSGRFDDVYFSREDGLAETRAVFLAGCGLPEAWTERTQFTVAELGFGTGLNIAALLALWRRNGPAGKRLSIFSIEGFPLTREEAARALGGWPDLADAAGALLDVWPATTPGFHRLDLPAFNATLDLAIGDVGWALSQWSGWADAWFLDGFAPSANPDMWSETVLDGIASRSAPDARLATFTVAGAVRRGLEARGFAVEKRPGHGRKRERLEARLSQPEAARKTPDAADAVQRIAIVGAGIAGAALARAFAALGTPAALVDSGKLGASGFPAALVTPRLDAGDTDVATLYAQALARARALYSALPDAVIEEGVLQLEQAPRDAARFRKIAAQPIWPPLAMETVDAARCSGRLGEPVDTGGLWMRDAMAVRPAVILSNWLGAAERITAAVKTIEQTSRGWRLLDESGDVILEAGTVVLAAGWGNADLAPSLPLAPVRGQADWIDGVVAASVAWGGYAAPTGTGLLFGATHDRGQVDGGPSAEASARNLGTVTERLPGLASRLEMAGPSNARTATRATTPDRLPLAGAAPSGAGLFILGGMGSRGFCAAPLLAEHVAALATGAPSPLPAVLAARVDPTRRDADGLRNRS